MLNEGTYKAKPISHDMSYTKAGDEMIGVALEITAPESCQGQFITWYGTFGEKALRFTKEALRNMGFVGNNLAEMQLDQEVQITVEHDEWDGKTRAKVRWVNSLNGRANIKDPMAPKAVRQFAAEMKAFFDDGPAHSGQESQRQQPQQQEPPAGRFQDDAPPPDDDSDIPF